MTEEYRFRCPDCGECIIVDEHVRDELLVQGCAVCSASVFPTCFNPV